MVKKRTRIYETCEFAEDKERLDVKINRFLEELVINDSQYLAFVLIDIKFFVDQFGHSRALVIYSFVRET
jgi:hypothetical protein